MHNYETINMITEINNGIISKNISDTLSLIGIAVIENGDNKVTGRNHWVGQGLETIGSYLVYTSTLNAASSNWSMYIGSDTTTPTTVSMTSLVSPIGTLPGTAPNSKSVSGAYYSTSTTPIVLTFIATWNAGTVSGILGEVGLYLTMNTSGLSSGAYSSNPGLASRLSAADGSLTAFAINTAATLTITWKINLTYA